LQELGKLAAKRKETPAELIRGLILRELKQDKQGMRPSVEVIEITALWLQIINLLSRSNRNKMTPESFDAIVQEVRIRKRGSALDVLKDYEQGGSKALSTVAKYPPLQRPSRRFARYAARKIARP
jgi:hypothetical protein